MSNPREIHGNNAKVPKGTKVEPMYAANSVTSAYKKDHEAPIVSDENVAYARKFQEENKK